MKFNKYLMMAFAVFASLALFACGDDTPTGGLDDLNGDNGDDNGTEETSALYVVGSYQGESGYGDDWEPEDAPGIYERDEDHFEGYVFFADAGEFKFTNERNWDDGDWGGSEGELEEGGDDIALEEGGYYKMNVDLGELTYEALATEWGVIGDGANGWDDGDDVVMEYDQDEKVWTVTLDLDEDGEIKFRANGAWDLNYGDNDGEGFLVEDGDNIPVEESGNYTVVLDLGGEDYTYEINQN